jgi:hypothetical protein
MDVANDLLPSLQLEAGGRALRGKVPGHLRVRTYACVYGPRMGHTVWRMGWNWTGELDR